MRRWVGSIALVVAMGTGAVGSLSLTSAGEPGHSPAARQQASAPQTFPAAPLRGYGTVSAAFRPVDGGSVLRIECESAAKAQLLVAKYLSDLGLLPGVRAAVLPIGGARVSVQEVAGQGSVAALRVGKTVTIAAAKDRAALAGIVKGALGDGLRAAVSRPETAVPMWLDRWDRFGFRFYYRPWERPTGETAETYDVTREFDWARSMDRAGMIFWADSHAADTAEGLSNDAWWNWAARSAAKRDLPIAINDTSGSATWLLNRYRDETQLKMPQFLGHYHKIADPGSGGTGRLSWASGAGKDAELGQIQQIVRRWAAVPQVVSFLEPHGELKHGPHDIFLDYGPVADADFCAFLKERYRTVDALARRWETPLKSWDDVRVPEIAEFAGWGPDALDLTGAWRYRLEPLPEGKTYSRGELTSALRTQKIPTLGAPAEWLSEDFDDGGWAALDAPGHDKAMLLEHRPAVLRRTFDIPADYRAKHKRLWLYVWDLNLGTGETVKATLNGKTVGEDTVRHNSPHRGMWDVGDAVRPGRNVLALRLPKGYLAYRAYLSPAEPKQYPDLGRGANARWVDFVEWDGHARVDTVRRGMQMIRQVDPNRPITLMHPDEFADGIGALAHAYGGNFHNTGWMGAFWGDMLPALMRGMEMPFSLEPGGPASDLPGFQKMMGLYATEGIQGIDYFIHIGNVMWHPEIRPYFERNLPIYSLHGKYHAPRAEVAALYHSGIAHLTGYPWGSDPHANLAAGYWNWNVRAPLRGYYESDGLSESSFDRGDAARYRVVLDTNTSILDDALLADIEKYVRDGGTFVTFVQTGRHTPTEKDAWPISRLTGYRVTTVDRFRDDGNPARTRTLKPAPDQRAFTGDWSASPASGLTLERTAPDAKDLMLWEDGTVAIGMRPLGRGYIVHVGPQFHGAKMFDRVEMGGDTAQMQALRRLLTALLQWRGVAPVPARVEQNGDAVALRHYVSNNGLYDVWTLWNQDARNAAAVQLAFDGAAPSTALEVVGQRTVALEHHRLPVTLEPLQTRVFLTPRGRIAEAPRDWLALQRAWWRAPAPVPAKPLPAPPHRFSVDLSDGWAFRPLADGEDGEAFAASTTDDATWKRMPLGIWSVEHPTVKRAVLRRTFTVPAAWTNGDPTLWLQSFFNTTFVQQGRAWLDGKPIRGWAGGGLPGVDPDGVLKPGTQHTLAIEVRGAGAMNGVRGACWLWYWPAPPTSLDLSGEWQPSPDLLAYAAPLRLPGDYSAFSLRRTVNIPDTHRAKTAVLSVRSSGIVGALVNEHYIRYHHHQIGGRWDLNVTPWLRFGRDNEIELVTLDGPRKGTVQSVRLGFYEPGTYP